MISGLEALKMKTLKVQCKVLDCKFLQDFVPSQTNLLNTYDFEGKRVQIKSTRGPRKIVSLTKISKVSKNKGKIPPRR